MEEIAERLRGGPRLGVGAELVLSWTTGHLVQTHGGDIDPTNVSMNLAVPIVCGLMSA